MLQTVKDPKRGYEELCALQDEGLRHFRAPPAPTGRRETHLQR